MLGRMSSRPAPSPRVIPPHPASREIRRWLVAGGALFAAGIMAMTMGLFAFGAAVALFGVVRGVFGWRGRAGITALPLLARAEHLSERRQFEAAGQLLDAAEKAPRNAAVQTAIHVQRGVMAMRRGEIERALGHLDAAVATPASAFAGWFDGRSQEALAHGMRAFLRASRGEEEGARADVEAARAEPDAGPSALSYAALAEEVLLERAGDRDGLRAHLRANAELLLNATGPRERAIVRAYQRMLQQAPAIGVYRVGAPREPAGAGAAEPMLADWVAKIAPGAAPFVRAAATRRLDAAETPDAGELASVPDQRAEGPAAVQGVVPVILALMVLVSGALVGGARMLRSQADNLTMALPDDAASGISFGTGLTAALCALLGLSVARTLGAKRTGRRLTAAGTLLVRGELDEAEDIAESVRAQARSALQVAQANLVLAGVHERRGEHALALRYCDRGLRQLGGPRERALASDVLYPGLLATRALALAVLDRQEEASAALASIRRGYAGYSAATLVVRLVQLSRRGDLREAARLVAESPPDLPLTRRRELLVDLVRAAHAPGSAGPGEVARLEEELRTWPEGKQWMEVVAPVALAAFERAREPERETESEHEHEHEHEREQLAEAEAASAEAYAPAVARR